jgi:hypothetical protein
MHTDYQASVLFLENYHAGAHIVINQGGTSSGKTYAIMQVLYAMPYLPTQNYWLLVLILDSPMTKPDV